MCRAVQMPHQQMLTTLAGCPETNWHNLVICHEFHTELTECCPKSTSAIGVVPLEVLLYLGMLGGVLSWWSSFFRFSIWMGPNICLNLIRMTSFFLKKQSVSFSYVWSSLPPKLAKNVIWHTFESFCIKFCTWFSIEFTPFVIVLFDPFPILVWQNLRSDGVNFSPHSGTPSRTVSEDPPFPPPPPRRGEPPLSGDLLCNVVVHYSDHRLYIRYRQSLCHRTGRQRHQCHLSS